ncbi:MAG: lysophospholipid acyltransferase family protein [Muribaculaceae bacterium]|nr:lysophospholipid acyltransferase family protein [Muribaculaceae bacterium]MDE6531910.1 lysophospholipid acyltransferase family protein [Muribaculaceae bacterium]
MDNNTPDNSRPPIRPEVITYDDIRKMVPALDGHPKIVERLLHFLRLDEINRIHSTYCDTPGVEFAHRLISEEFKFKLRIDNLQVLSQFPEQPFITVSNHPFGSYDGILLLDIVGEFRPDFKVMVNLILNNIQAMRENFIAVDPLKTDDPEKKKITMQGIREAMKHVKAGHPLGFFPAGAMSKLDKSLTVRDREWQPSIIRLIKQLQVPVIPIFFHGHNSWIFNALGIIDWRLRSMRLPREVMRAYGREIHVSIGDPISVERQNRCESVEALSDLLRGETYALKAIK